MRVAVDRVLCEANGRCVQVAPDIFSLDDDEELHIVPPPDDVDPMLVARAVASCPRNALESDAPPFTRP